MTRVYSLEDGEALAANAREAFAAAVREGKIVVFPTDTVYGLGTCGLDAAARRRIYELKARDAGKPLPIFVHSFEEARRWTAWPPDAVRLARRHWPGALTVVLHPTEEGRRLLSPGAETLAVRVPDHPVVLDLLRASGVPWATTSANLSGQPALRGGAEVIAAFSGKADCILTAGRNGGRESTVIEAVGNELRVLREGAIRL